MSYIARARRIGQLYIDERNFRIVSEQKLAELRIAHREPAKTEFVVVREKHSGAEKPMAYCTAETAAYIIDKCDLFLLDKHGNKFHLFNSTRRRREQEFASRFRELGWQEDIGGEAEQNALAFPKFLGHERVPKQDVWATYNYSSDTVLYEEHAGNRRCSSHCRKNGCCEELKPLSEPTRTIDARRKPLSPQLRAEVEQLVVEMCAVKS
jgi:hypothetical protein